MRLAFFASKSTYKYGFAVLAKNAKQYERSAPWRQLI